MFDGLFPPAYLFPTREGRAHSREDDDAWLR
jgi:hypothetical protein